MSAQPDWRPTVGCVGQGVNSSIGRDCLLLPYRLSCVDNFCASNDVNCTSRLHLQYAVIWQICLFLATMTQQTLSPLRVFFKMQRAWKLSISQSHPGHHCILLIDSHLSPNVRPTAFHGLREQQIECVLMLGRKNKKNTR